MHTVDDMIWGRYGWSETKGVVNLLFAWHGLLSAGGHTVLYSERNGVQLLVSIYITVANEIGFPSNLL
jgi:hypothetical protein